MSSDVRKRSAPLIATAEQPPSVPMVDDDLRAILPGVDHWTLHVAIWLGRLGQIWEQNLEVTLRPFGVIPAEMRVLSMLLLAPADAEISIGHVGRHVVLTTGGLTKAVARLSQAGLLVKYPHHTDKRITLLKLTERGREIGVQANLSVAAFLNESVGHLGESDRCAIFDALSMLLANIRMN